MPIEILPPTANDWTEFSSKADIEFITLDPFWPTKSGKVIPSYAILFRGGTGFLDRSVDGGKNWSSIMPATQPPWFETTEYTGWSNPPFFWAPSEEAPTKYEVTYHDVVSNPAHINEHYAIVDYTVLAGGGRTYNIHHSWVLYTLDDWSTSTWIELEFDGDIKYAAITEETPYTVASTITSHGGLDFVRIAADLFAAFYKVGTTIYCHAIQPSGSTFTSVGSDSHVETDAIFGQAQGWVHGNKVYYGRIMQDGQIPAGGGGNKNAYRAYVQEWQILTTGASFIAEYESDYLPDIDSTNQFATDTLPWAMTEGGLLAFLHGSQDTVCEASDPRKRWYFHFSTASKGFSIPHLLYDGTGSTVPDEIYHSVQYLSGNEVIIHRYEVTDYTNNPGNPSHEFMIEYMTIGIWSSTNQTTYWGPFTSASTWDITSALLYGNKYLIGNDTSSKMYTYSESSKTFVFIDGPDAFSYPYSDGENLLLGSPQNYFFSWDRSSGDGRMFWTEPEWDYKIAPYSEEITGLGRTASVSDFDYGYIQYDGVADEVELVRFTVENPPPIETEMQGIKILGRSAMTGDGDTLLLPVASYQWALGAGLYAMMVYQIDRNGSTGIPEPYNFIQTFERYATLQNLLDRVCYLGIRADPSDNDRVWYYGNFDGVSDPTDSPLIGYEDIGGSDWFADERWGTDIVSGLCRIGSNAYVLRDSGSVVTLYEGVPISGDFTFTSKSTVSLDTVIGGCIDVDNTDDSIVVAGGVADLIMVVISASPYTSWSNLTYSHRNDRGVTALIVLE